MKAFWFAAIFLIQSQITDQVQPGAVTGRLLSPNGTPASGVRIAAVPFAEGEDKTGASALFGISQTGEDGQYRLEKLPPGRYYIFAGLIDFPSYYPHATSLDRASAIVVEAGMTTSGVDFSMARPLGLTVAGHLEIPSTLPYSEGWIVTLISQNRSAGTSLESKVRRDGSFEFERVSPGDYRIFTNLTGAGSTNVKVVDADLNVVLPVVDCNTGVLVSGRLVGTPTTVIQSISLSGSGSGCSARTRVEPDGSFTFNKVPQGTYQLQLLPAPLGWLASSLKVEKTDLTGAEVRLPPLIAVKGQARTEDGSAFPRAARGVPVPVRAVLVRGGGEVSTSINDDGTFELLLPRGDYRISVPGVPTGYRIKSMTSGIADLETSALIVREIQSTPTEIQLTLAFNKPPEQPGVRLAGRLSFAATGALPISERVLLVSTSGRRNAEIRESTLGTDGSFEFTGVPPGIYNLETFPDNPAALYGIVVEKTDVTGIEYAIPALVKVKGGIEWANSEGAAVPAARPNLSVQFTRKEGSRMLAWGALAQSGAFHFYLPEGDYRFSVSDIPTDFNLSAVTSGDANILETGLRVRPDSDPPSLRVTLRGK